MSNLSLPPRRCPDCKEELVGPVWGKYYCPTERKYFHPGPMTRVNMTNRQAVAGGEQAKFRPTSDDQHGRRG